MTTLRIGQIAEGAGVGVETVRFYERRGLLDEPPRTASGYRAYPAGSVERLRFIRRAQGLGFSLAEIREFLVLYPDSRNACGSVQTQVEGKLAEVEAKIRNLRRVRRALRTLATACRTNQPLAACPLLRALGESEETP